MTDLKSSAENCNSKSNIVVEELADRKKGYFKSYSQSNINNNNNNNKKQEWKRVKRTHVTCGIYHYCSLSRKKKKKTPGRERDRGRCDIGTHSLINSSKELQEGVEFLTSYMLTPVFQWSSCFFKMLLYLYLPLWSLLKNQMTV